MKLSELIEELQNKYNKYGDGLVYMLDECATRQAVGIDADPQYGYRFDPVTLVEYEPLEKVEYRIYGYGYSTC